MPDQLVRPFTLAQLISFIEQNGYHCSALLTQEELQQSYSLPHPRAFQMWCEKSELSSKVEEICRLMEPLDPENDPWSLFENMMVRVKLPPFSELWPCWVEVKSVTKQEFGRPVEMKGVFAVTAIPRGTLLGCYAGWHYPTAFWPQHLSWIENDPQKPQFRIEPYVCPINPLTGRLDTASFGHHFSWYINEASGFEGDDQDRNIAHRVLLRTPNVGIFGRIDNCEHLNLIYTIRDIQPGEELLTFYGPCYIRRGYRIDWYESHDLSRIHPDFVECLLSATLQTNQHPTEGGGWKWLCRHCTKLSSSHRIPALVHPIMSDTLQLNLLKRNKER